MSANDTGFPMEFFLALVDAKYPHQPEPARYHTLQQALLAFRTRLRLTHTDFAELLGISRPAVIQAETITGRSLNPTTLHRLAQLAAEHGFPVLADYFRYQQTLARDRVTRRGGHYAPTGEEADI